MAINSIMKATLKAISGTDLNTKNTYQLHRTVINFARRRLIRPFYKIWDHKVTLKDHDIKVRIFSPKLQGDFPVLLFFHGGGWVTGSIDSYDRMCTNLAELTQHTVVSVDYRLAPEHKFPAGLEDCYSVAKEIFLHPGLLGVTEDQITLIGDSAGGNLAAAVSLLARDRGEFLPTRQILLYPALYNDHSDASPYASVKENGADYILTSKRIRDYMDLYAASDGDRKNPYFAPLLAQDLSGQPQTLIITAQYDPLRDEGEAYACRLREAGIPAQAFRIKDAIHGFFDHSPHFTQVKAAYGLINSFLREGTAK